MASTQMLLVSRLCWTKHNTGISTESLDSKNSFYSNGHESIWDDEISHPIPTTALRNPRQMQQSERLHGGIIIQTFNLPLHIILTFILQGIPFTNITVW